MPEVEAFARARRTVRPASSTSAYSVCRVCPEKAKCRKLAGRVAPGRSAEKRIASIASCALSAREANVAAQAARN
jgi:hypothetical protein